MNIYYIILQGFVYLSVRLSVRVCLSVNTISYLSSGPENWFPFGRSVNSIEPERERERERERQRERERGGEDAEVSLRKSAALTCLKDLDRAKGQQGVIADDYSVGDRGYVLAPRSRTEKE